MSIINTIGMAAEVFRNMDLKDQQTRKILNFVEDHLKNPQPLNNFTLQETVEKLESIKADCHKMFKIVDDHRVKLRETLTIDGNTVIPATAEAFKEFLPYF